MNGTAIVTGGTGGLGTAVVETMIAAGWHVVAPWVAEKELERLPERDGPDARPGRPARPGRGGRRRHGGDRRRRGAAARRGQSRGRLRRGRARARDADRGLRAPVHAQPAADLPGHGGRAAPPARGGRRRGRVRVHPGRAAALLRRGGLHQLQGGRARLRARAGRRVSERWGPRERDPAERDRHAGQPRLAARRRLLEVGRAGGDRAVIRFLCSEDSSPTSGAEIPVYGRA